MSNTEQRLTCPRGKFLIHIETEVIGQCLTRWRLREEVARVVHVEDDQAIEWEGARLAGSVPIDIRR